MDGFELPQNLPAPVKTSRLTAMLLAAACTGLIASPAHAGTIYNESINGDINGSPSTLPLDTTTVIGTLSTSTPDIFDNFVIPLPNTGSPTPLKIDYLITGSGGVTYTFDFGATTGSPLFTLHQPPSAGSINLIIPSGLSLKVGSFVGETGTVGYTLNITNLSAAPLPNPAALTAAGLLGLGAAALLGRRAKSSAG